MSLQLNRWFAAVLLAGCGAWVQAATSTSRYYYFPVSSSTAPANNTAWSGTVDWKAVPGLPTNQTNTSITSAENDILGAYYASTTSFLYFRIKVRSTTAITDYNTPFNNDVFTVIVDDLSTSKRVDTAFAWDVQTANSISNHGLELTVPTGTYSSTTSWSAVAFADKDGSSGQKLTPDFDTLSGTFDPTKTDGYIRATQYKDGSTVTETYIDYAISWNYLTTGSGTVSSLKPTSTVQLAFATKHTGNDHATYNNITDILGVVNLSTDTLSTGFSSPVVVPEPGVLTLGVLLAGAVFVQRRRR